MEKSRILLLGEEEERFKKNGERGFTSSFLVSK